MPDTDAFGRTPGEDPLAGIGGAPTGAPVPAPAPTGLTPPPPPTPAATTPTPPAATPQAWVPPSRSGGIGGGAGRPIRILIIVAIVAIALGGGITALVSSVSKSVSKVGSLPDFPTTSVPTTTSPTPSPPSGPAVAPTGLARGSMLRPAAFAKAIARVRAKHSGKLRVVRVEAGRVDVVTVTADGRIGNFDTKWDGTFFDSPLTGPGFGTQALLPFSAVHVDAPQRLVRQAARRSHTSASKIDYAVLTDFAGTPQWTVIVKDGAQYVADVNGNIKRRIN